SAANSAASDFAMTESFSASAPVAAGVNQVVASATDAQPATANQKLRLSINGPANQALTFDSNGNMVSDGSSVYKYDAENRLTEIDFQGSGDKSVFSFGPTGHRVKIVEYSGGSVASTKQFVSSEERDGSSAVTKQFFKRGEEIIGASPYFFTKTAGG